MTGGDTILNSEIVTNPTFRNGSPKEVSDSPKQSVNRPHKKPLLPASPCTPRQNKARQDTGGRPA